MVQKTLSPCALDESSLALEGLTWKFNWKWYIARHKQTCWPLLSLDIFCPRNSCLFFKVSILKPLLHYAGNLLATWWQKMVAGDCHHIFTPIIFYWIKFVQCIFYIEDIVNKYLLTHLLPPVANGRQYVASKISASVKGALGLPTCTSGR